MPVFSVRKSIQIAAPAAKVYEVARDFRQWPAWSPWLHAEPSCDVTYAADGKSYSWEGKIVGSGELAIATERPPESIDYRLVFRKPWKSVNQSQFLLAGQGGGTRVTWTMRGKLPWFLFWMKDMMTAYVGMDYERGLSMLKDLVETGEVSSALEFHSAVAVEGFSFVGIRERIAIPDLGVEMGKAFGRLRDVFEARELEPAGKPFSIYHAWKPRKGFVEFTAGLPVGSLPDDLPADVVTGDVPACTAYTIQHTGAYRHLGNAWSAGYMRARARPPIFAMDRRVEPFETYQNDPDDTAERDLVTIVHFPEK